jgi:CBS domain-containing protein
MTVRDLVTGDAIWIDPDATLRRGAEMMISHEMGSVAVQVDDALEGILTERDILRAVSDGADLDEERAGDWMTDHPDTFTPDMDIDEAADWMLASGFRHLPVVDEGRVIGVISIKDVLWALTDST